MRTEEFAHRYQGLETWDDNEILETLLEGQLLALASIKPALGNIAKTTRAAAERLRDPSGRLMYAGAGTSGRLAVQDGTELVPTYNWPPERLSFLLAGGTEALTQSIEGAEDDADAGAAALRKASTGPADVLVAVSASGRTPYTLGACRAAREAGTLTIGIAQNEGAALLHTAEHALWLDTGPEPIAGSTRMKAGTAQKVTLNLFSTLLMIRLGRVYKGLMVDMHASNVKLQDRAVRIVQEISAVEQPLAAKALAKAGGDVKVAALIAKGLTAERAKTLLADSGQDLAAAMARI